MVNQGGVDLYKFVYPIFISLKFPMPSMIFQWLSLLGIIWLQSINGTNFNFPSYSSQLKHLLSMSQLQLNNLAFASDAGKLFGWIPGIAAVYLPLWLVLLIGSTLGLIGYGVQYLFITEQICCFSYWHICLLTVLAGNSICWINTVCYVVAIRNFPFNRQVVVGISTSYQGLSAKIYIDVVKVVFSSSPVVRAKAFLLINSILPLIVSIMASPLTGEIDRVDKSSKNSMEVGIVVIFVITIATGVFAVVSSLDMLTSGFSPLKSLIGIGAFMLAPLLIPIAEQIKKTATSKLMSISSEKRIYDFTMNKSDHIDAAGRIRSDDNDDRNWVDGKEGEEYGGKYVEVKVEVIEEIGVKKMVKRVNFWLYFLVYFCGGTVGLVYLNNLGQIAESRRQTSSVPSLVSLSSSFGFFGRLFPSVVGHFFSRRNKYMMISRPAALAGLMGAMGGAFIMLLINQTKQCLYGSTAIIGVSTGAISAMAVSLTTELFGAENFSVNHNVVVANIPVGSFVYGYVAAFLYRKQLEKDDLDEAKCIGTDCYTYTFILWASLCFLGIIPALLLHARTHTYYSSLIHKS